MDGDPLRKHQLFPNSHIAAFATHTRSGFEQIMCCSHLLLTGGLKGSCWDHLWWHHRQLLVWCFLLFLPPFFNLQAGWANTAVERTHFCPCIIDSENAAREARASPQHSSKYTSAASSKAHQLLAPVSWGERKEFTSLHDVSEELFHNEQCRNVGGN